MIRVDKNMIQILESIGLIHRIKDSFDAFHKLDTNRIHIEKEPQHYSIKANPKAHQKNSPTKTSEDITFFSGHDFWECLKKTEKKLNLFLFRLN